jgi:tetratricopeptide (TPR) repeat protein
MSGSGPEADRRSHAKPFDLGFRPDSYLVPDSPADFAVLGLRGWLRRRQVRDRLAAGDAEGAHELVARPERTLATLPSWDQRELPEMVGEYLPALASGEVELFRFQLRDRWEVTSVRARPMRGGWELRVVDEHRRHYFAPRAWYAQPLTLAELIAFTDSAGYDLEHPGLVFGLLERTLAEAGGVASAELLRTLRELHEIESSFYPELVRWYEEAVAAWCEAQVFRTGGPARARSKPGEPGASDSKPRPTPGAPPASTPQASGEGSRAESASHPPTTRESSDPFILYQREMERIMRAGEDDEARAHFETVRAHQDARGGRAWAAWIFGMAAERAGRFDLAHEFYASGRTDGTSDGQVDYWLHNNDGYSLHKLGRDTEAEPLCRHATEALPERYNAWKNLGLSLAGQARVVEAARAFLTAMRACPTEQRARSHLMDLLPDHADTIAREVPELAAFVEQWRKWQRSGARSHRP